MVYVEGGYYVSPMLAVGGFAGFGTNNEYIPKETYVFDGGAYLPLTLTGPFIRFLSARLSDTASRERYASLMLRPS